MTTDNPMKGNCTQDTQQRSTGIPVDGSLGAIQQQYRNTDIEQATVERMVALVRKMAPEKYDVRQHMRVTEAVQEARAIAALLPQPVDPLLIEAREIVVETIKDGDWAGIWAAGVRAGMEDNGDGVRIALAALRKAREEGVK